MERYKPLYDACVKGDWDSVKRFVEDSPDPDLWTTGIDILENPALCVAAFSGQTELMRNLVELMPEEALLIPTRYNGYTPLHYIAENGDVEAAKFLVTKIPFLTQIPNIHSATPLLVATRYGCREMVRYLVTVTKDEPCDIWPSPFRFEQGAALLVGVINLNLYDVALDLVKKYEGIATAKNSDGMSAISSLAKKSWPDSAMSRDNDRFLGLVNLLISGMPAISSLAKKSWPDSAMSRGVTISPANHIMYKQYLELTECICNKIRLLDTITMNDILQGEGVLLEASKQGCVNFLKAIINIDSSQIMLQDQGGNSILHIAIRHRQREVFHYLKHLRFEHELSHMINKDRDTILHVAAKMSPDIVLYQISGAAFQVQHEFQWYKEVAAMVPFYNDFRNREGLTPKDIFDEEHRDLVREGKKWMQNIASLYMVVATPIATIVFAAAFTVSGGARSDMGLLFFLNKMSYLVFAVSDAMALFFSLTSVLIFLSILTSSYGIEDFLVSLPRRLIIGEAMLFFAIPTMTMAFGATYFIRLGHKLALLSILIAFFICLLVILFVMFVILQPRLFYDIFKSAYMC